MADPIQQVARPADLRPTRSRTHSYADPQPKPGEMKAVARAAGAKRAAAARAPVGRVADKAMAAAGAAAMAVAATPLPAAAAVTPSLSNLLNSVLAGGFVIVGLAGAVTFVSTFDKLDARK